MTSSSSTADLPNNLGSLSLSEQIDPWSRPIDDNDPEDSPVATNPPITASNGVNPVNTPSQPDGTSSLPTEVPPSASSGPTVEVDRTVLNEFDPLSNEVEQEAKEAWEQSGPHPPVVPPKASPAQSEPPTQDKPAPSPPTIQSFPPPAPIPVPDPVPIPPTQPITDKPLPDPSTTASTAQDSAQSISRSTTPSFSGLAAIARNFIPKAPVRTPRPLSIDQASVILSPTVATFGASTQDQSGTHKRAQSLGQTLSPLNPELHVRRDENRPQTPGSAPRTPKSAAKDVDKDHPPPFDFQLFLEQIKSKGAEPVAKYLRSWVPTIIKPSLDDMMSFHL